MANTDYTINITVSNDEFEKLYRGVANRVNVMSDQGKRLSFPASNLKPFLDRNGINGRFKITIDSNNKLLKIIRV